MANRFIDTDLFMDSWFMKLSIESKLFFIYLITSCDHAGIIDLNISLAEFQTKIIGLERNFEKIKKEFGERLILLKDDYYFLPKFILFQYPKGLNVNVPAHKSVISKLESFSIDINSLKPFSNPLQRVKDKDKDKDKDFLKGVKGENFIKFEFEILEEYEPILKDWLEYKKERKESYKNNRSIEACYKKLLNYSSKDPEVAQEIIDKSMANNWAGFFPLDPRELERLNKTTSTKLTMNDYKKEYKPTKFSRTV